MHDYKLDDEDFLDRAKKINANTIKPYGKLDIDKPTKLTPLRKGD